MDKKQLIDFENEIAEIYESGEIRGPIHLRDGNEDKLIEIFKGIDSRDYVFSTWANHLHVLLKGVPPEKLKARILEGESMAANFPEYNCYTSAIVGGICPIAVGVAAGLIRNKKLLSRVFIFIGDMTLLTGVASESIRYSINYDLPVTWVIEDNNKSVCTLTRETWRDEPHEYVLDWKRKKKEKRANRVDFKYYKYESKWPHSSTGVFISF